MRERLLATFENRQRAVVYLLMSFAVPDPEDARQIVQQGLTIEPTNRALLHRRDSLGKGSNE